MVNPDKNPFFATVIAIDGEENGLITTHNDAAKNCWSVVLNVGSQDGVELKQKFVIFSLGPELFDPATKESLGHFEVVRGRGEVTHLQERMCTVRSSAYRMERRAPVNPFAQGAESELVRVSQPFDLVVVGDLARRV
jgi:hypothetical protein